MKSAGLLDKLLAGAKDSSWGLWKLNFVLLRFIPFNLPHTLKIISISEEKLETALPYKRKNLNHLKGIHACAIATLAEYTSGIFLLQKASSSGYRIIMKSIHVEYHYQAKSSVKASFGMSDEEFERRVSTPLNENGVLLDDFNVEVHDDKGNHIATGTIQWQMKDWSKVRTKR